MVFKDYYKILGLETNKVNIDEIKIAFREQAKKYHPDVNNTRFAEERFKDINEAYNVLSESRLRRKYDRIWYSHVGKKIERQQDKEQREARPDLLTLLFGTIRNKKDKVDKKQTIRGEDIETEITIDVKEAFLGITKSINLRAIDGKVKTFSVKIPAGIRNGEKLRLIAQGKKGQNGGKNGDLLIKINIENTPEYKLKGVDLYTNLYLTPWEAALGTKAKIKTIDNEEINVYIPKGMQPTEIIKLAGKGYKDGKGSRGNLIAKIKITVPKQLTEEEEKLYAKLKELAENTNNEKQIKQDKKEDIQTEIKEPISVIASDKQISIEDLT